MTTNQTIDGVPRELRALLERVAGKASQTPHWDALDEDRIAATAELRALLDADQPALAAVVLPEREMYCQYLRGVIPDNRLEVESHKDGWNACLDELKRLNPSL